MKKIFFAAGLTLILSVAAVTVFAQTESTAHRAPKWVSDNGYWVIETNTHTPKLNTICFYNTDNELVYKEKVDGVVINLKKRRVKMNLKKVLDQSVIAYNKTKKAAENEMLVINLIRH
jgi:hypothetical protein